MSVDPGTAPLRPAFVRDATGNYYRISDSTHGHAQYLLLTGGVITGALTVEGPLSAEDTLAVGSSLTVATSVDVGTTLDVAGAATVGGALGVTGALDVTGAATVGDSLVITGTDGQVLWQGNDVRLVADGEVLELTNEAGDEFRALAVGDPIEPEHAVPLGLLESHASVQSGFRNVIRHGDLRVAQRGNGPWSTNGYTADGWYAYSDTAGTKSVGRYVPPGGAGKCQITFASTDAVNGVLFHYVEDVNTFAGMKATLSFNAHAASGTPTIKASLAQDFGSGGSADTETALASFTLSTTSTRYTATFDVPDVAGKTVGAGSALRLTLYLSGSGGLDTVNNTFAFTDLQLEQGERATPFERLPMAMQLAWCQRFFQRWQQPPLRGVLINATSVGRMAMALPVEMRTTPTVTASAPLPIYNGILVGTATIAGNLSTPSKVELDMTTSGYTAPSAAGQAVLVIQSGAAYLDLSAEMFA